MVGTLKSGSHRVSTGICPTTLQKWSTSKGAHSMEPPTSFVAPTATNLAPRPPCWFSYQTLTLCGLNSYFVANFSKMTFIPPNLAKITKHYLLTQAKSAWEQMQLRPLLKEVSFRQMCTASLLRASQGDLQFIQLVRKICQLCTILWLTHKVRMEPKQFYIFLKDLSSRSLTY